MHDQISAAPGVQRLIKRTYRRLLPRRARQRAVSAAYFGLDALDRLLHPRELVPPRHLVAVGPGNFKKVGEEYLRHFRELAGLPADAAVLEVGCGVGRLALPLVGYLDAQGSYDAFDIVPAAIEWCTRNITRRRPNFLFQVADVRNREFNPAGGVDGTAYRFPYADATFDFAFSQSVFTHMVPPEVANYIAEMARVLKPGGRWLSTFYLVNAESDELTLGGRGVADLRFSMDFAYRFEGYRTIDPDVPEAAVALDEPLVLDLIKKAGLLQPKIYYGSWSGRTDFTAYQDIVVATRGS